MGLQIHGLANETQAVPTAMVDPNQEPKLVVCVDCGAMRSSVWPTCFCGESTTKPAPPPKDKDSKLRLFEEQKG